MKEPIHLLSACNSGYIMPLCVMLASLVDHFDRERDLIIHIISSDASVQDRENIQDSIRTVRPDLKHVEILWHTIEPERVANLAHKDPRFSRDVFSRLFAPYVLPPTCDRLIYLDCDMVVLEDVSKLYDSTLGSPKLLHAAHDLGCPLVSSPVGVFDYAERGIPATNQYFNSGVLVINLKRWREVDLTPRLLQYLIENGSKVHESDQGALNALAYNDWQPLDLRWNSGTYTLTREIWTAAGYSEANWGTTRDHPYIIHYTGHKKPWIQGVISPRYSYFFKYLQKTPYKDTIPNRPRLEDYFGFPLYYQFWNFLRKLRGRPASA